MVPVYARSVLATLTCAFVSGELPTTKSKLRSRVAYLDYPDSSYVYHELTTTATAFRYTTTTSSRRLNDDINHVTINRNKFINDNYITHGIIDHYYGALTLGYIDIGITGYHLE
jgi:hypothetical protein